MDEKHVEVKGYLRRWEVGLHKRDGVKAANTQDAEHRDSI